MPSPVAHSLAGTAIQFMGRGPSLRRQWLSLILLVFAANLADIDFIPGYFVGDPRAFHWGATHSLFAAIVLGGAVGMVIGALTGRYRSSIVMSVLAYGSHIPMDMLLGPSAFPLGLQVFWPFSTRRFMLPWSVFRMAPDSISAGPVAAIRDVLIIPVIVRELWLMVPVAGAAWLFSRLRIHEYKS